MQAALAPQASPAAPQARAGSAAQRAAPSIPLQASAAPGCPRLHSTSSTAAHTATPGKNRSSGRFPSAAATAAPVSRVPKPGFSGGKRRSASPSSPASRASAVQNSARSALPPVPSAKHRPMAANVPQPASTAGRNLPGQTHRTATAAPSAHNKQTLRSDSAPKPCSSTPSAAPAAQGAKQSSARPSTRPSPKGISAPYSTAQPPANPRATAPSRRTAGRNTARASSAGAPLRRAFTVKTLVRSVIQNSPLSGGAFWFCSPHCVHIL